MQIRSIILSSFLFCNGGIIYADTLPTSPKSNPKIKTDQSTAMFNQLSLGGLYSYTDFKFDSTVSGNFNRFQGHSNLYSIGAGNARLGHDVSAGIAIFRVDTSFNSQVSLNSGILPSTGKQTIHNNTLFGHVLKYYKPYVFLDLAAGYGQNKVVSESWIMANTPDQQYGYAHTRNTNWFASLTSAYHRPWKKFVLRANARLLYSQANAGRYMFNFQSVFPAKLIEPMTNKVWFLMENAELGYNLNPTLTPFINGGLIQIVHYANSRPLINLPINSTFPQLSMNKNGFKLGGGVAINYKQLTLRLEEQYYNAGGTYTSTQTIAGFKYLMS